MAFVGSSCCFFLILVVLTGSFADRPTPRIMRFKTTTTVARETTTTTAPSTIQSTNVPWECGTDEFTKAISEGEILAKCPALRDVVNGCCYVHDACYDAQNGQKLCDDNFCNCLELATRPSTACHNESSPVFCDLVRTFGDDAYLNSGPNATIIVDEEKNDAEKDYDYETAVKKNLTLF